MVGVVGSPFESRGGLTVQDWTIFIYNRAEENRFVPDDIFIDWNMYCPPSHWKWLISGLVVAVLFLGGQGAMSTQHVGPKMNSLVLSLHGFFNLSYNWTEKKGKKGCKTKESLQIFSVCRLPNKMSGKRWKKSKMSVFMTFQLVLNVTHLKKKRDDNHLSPYPVKWLTLHKC